MASQFFRSRSGDRIKPGVISAPGYESKDKEKPHAGRPSAIHSTVPIMNFSDEVTMTLFFAGKTKCSICCEPIEAVTDAVGFPAFIPLGHEFERFSDASFHRECFNSCDDSSRFLQLYESYNQIRSSRPVGVSLEEMNEWGRNAFSNLFTHEKRL